MKKKVHITIILIFISGLVLGQTFIDQIILNSGDTIYCKITLINDQNIFYTYKSKRTEKYNHVLLEGVDKYHWLSKNLKYQTQTEKDTYPFDTTNNWKVGVTLTQYFKYPVLHTTPTLSIFNKNHNLYIGPEYTMLLEESLGDPEDSYQQEYWGINFGYRYFINSFWWKTNLFLQMNFSIYQIKFKVHQLGPSQETYHKQILVEITGGLGVSYKFTNRLSANVGIGFGGTTGGYIRSNELIPQAFLGIEYKIKK